MAGTFGDEREQEIVVNPNMLRESVVVDEVLRPDVEPLREWPGFTGLRS